MKCESILQVLIYSSIRNHAEKEQDEQKEAKKEPCTHIVISHHSAVRMIPDYAYFKQYFNICSRMRLCASPMTARRPPTRMVQITTAQKQDQTFTSRGATQSLKKQKQSHHFNGQQSRLLRDLGIQTMEQRMLRLNVLSVCIQMLIKMFFLLFEWNELDENYFPLFRESH